MQSLYGALALCFLLCLPCAVIGDEVEDAVKAHAQRVAKATEEYELQVKRSAATAIVRLEAAAKSAIRAGDLAGANKAWREVLALDLAHAQARAHFQSLGQLDKVLAELKPGQEASGPVSIKYGEKPFVIETFKFGAKLFTDRDYRITSAPKELEGLNYTLLTLTHHENVRVEMEVAAGQTVYVIQEKQRASSALPVKTHLADLAIAGWKEIGAATIANSTDPPLLVVAKKFSKPEKVTFAVCPNSMILAKSLSDLNAKLPAAAAP